jgi:WXG100 family type VII secretion target
MSDLTSILNKILQIQYGDMGNIINGMKSEQAEVQQMFQQTKNKVDSLHNNQWQGEAADKFFMEMENSVLPSLNRLAIALGDCATTAQKVKDTIQQADEGAKGTLGKMVVDIKGIPGGIGGAGIGGGGIGGGG